MRQALQQCHDLIASTLAQVSHGGPTRAEAEAVLKQAKQALDDPANGAWVRAVEQTFAYERAADIIKSECNVVETAGAFEEGWYDLDSAIVDLDDEIRYLDARRLLERHPEHRNWVILRDEGDPIGEEKELSADGATA